MEVRRNMNGCILQLSHVLFTLVLLILTDHVMYAENEKGFCEMNLFEKNKTSLEFTKEVNTFDYVVIERYKSLSCCAKGYKTIKWYKDGNIISAGNRNITFHELREQNQTLISIRVTDLDNGTYTCKVSDGINEIQRKIQLKVMPEVTYMGPALLTYVTESYQYAQIGETARFFCEGFIGHGKKHNSQVAWVMDKTNTFPDTSDKRRYTKSVARAEDLIIGEYLIFKTVTKEDFGTYKCTISNGGSPKVFNVTLIEGDNPTMKIRTSYKATVVIISVFTCSVVLLIGVYMRWHLELHLFWKDHFGKLEDDNKEYDVFVCYDQTDTEFALGVLVHTLEKCYHYRCFVYERDSVAGDWIPEIYTMKIRSSRRFLMVLSPALAINSWCTYALYVAIEAMLNLHSKIICVVLQVWTFPGRILNKPMGPVITHCNMY
ncbi:interleukin-1 receptor accessory protein-like 1 isoform X2 [Zootermopsis nevadensis]|uniref:interleukin-1 receptor accessory protein-like 1 isoform X2 n=1 Tax=Zootermopsis nevadensis TaxID=136037 RepID=UPI000B8EBED7|nr:interleukin-1 receptor accessory protein-like 1 isoform X2 [Zootermopsis nevadensis]